MARRSTHVVVDALRGAIGPPRLIVATHGPSMGLVLRAERLGGAICYPSRYAADDSSEPYGACRSAAAEVAIPLPEVGHHASETMRSWAAVRHARVYKLMARVGRAQPPC